METKIKGSHEEKNIEQKNTLKKITKHYFVFI